MAWNRVLFVAAIFAVLVAVVALRGPDTAAPVDQGAERTDKIAASAKADSTPAAQPGSPPANSTEPRREILPSLSDALTQSDPIQATSLYATRLDNLPASDFSREFEALMAARGDAILRSYGGPFSNQGPPAGDLLARSLLIKWGQVDPNAAMAAIEARERDTRAADVAERMKNVVLEGWIVADPDAAWSWAAANTPPEAAGRPSHDRERYPPLITALVAAGKTSTAARLLALPTTSSVVYNLPTDFARIWGRTNPQETEAWLAALPPDQTARIAGTIGFGEALAQIDLNRALAYSRSLSNDLSGAALLGVLRSFSHKNDPPGALAWLAGAIEKNSDGRFDHIVFEYALLRERNPQISVDPDLEESVIAKVASASRLQTIRRRLPARN